LRPVIEAPDEELARLVAAGDVTAFSTLYDRYAARVYSWAAHVIGAGRAEDVTQDVFLVLWRKAGQFDETRARFSVWFMTVARNRVRRELRSVSSGQVVMGVEEIEQRLLRLGQAGDDPLEAAAERLAAERVRRAVAELPQEQRRVLLLAYFGALSQSAIASRLGIPLGTVKKRVRLGMAKLRTAMGATSASAKEEAR